MYFLLENVIELLDFSGIHYQPLLLDIALPVGISFYTSFFSIVAKTIRFNTWHGDHREY